MSLAAYIWASNLPLDVVGATPYRVLLKYADRADEHGRTAWWTAKDLAATLGCTDRTAQRAVRELRDAGLLIEGDQRHVQHLRGDRRPTVFDLAMRTAAPARIDLGDGFDGATTGVVPSRPRYDRSGPHGTTTAVAHRTVIEPIDTSTNVSTERYDRSVVPSQRPYYGVQPAPSIPRYVPEPPKPRPAPRTTAEAEAVSDLESLPCPAARGFHHWVPLGSTECVRGCGTSLTVERTPQ